MKVNMHEAKCQLSKLGKLALEGEEIVIAKAGKPYLHLLPYTERKAKRRPGALKGKIRMAADFDRTPREVIDGFEGR